MITLLTALMALVVGLGLAPAQPEVAVAPPAQEDAGADIASADELLTALEHAGEDIRRLSADIAYDKTFGIQGDTQIRTGRLVFESKPGEVEGAAPARRFGITFDTFQVGGRVEDAETDYLEQFIFDGEWLAEIRPLEKEFVRRQVVPPGERWDPLKVGEGPFPIPIQQKREDILARFDAELVSSAEALDSPKLLALADSLYQLKLTPREELGEDDLREIRIWYEKESLLPRIARTETAADDISLVLLKNVKVNEEAEVSETDLSTELPADRTGIDITVEPFRGAE